MKHSWFLLIFYSGLGFASSYVQSYCPRYIQKNSFQSFINNYCMEHSNSVACENQQPIVNILNLYSEGFSNIALDLPSQTTDTAQVVLSQIGSALYGSQSFQAQNLNCNIYSNLLFVMLPSIYKSTLVTNCQSVIGGSSSVNYIVPYQYYQNKSNHGLCDYLKNNYQFCNKMPSGSPGYATYNCDVFNNSKLCYEKTEPEILDILFNNYLVTVSQCADSGVVMDDLFYAIDYGDSILNNNAQPGQIVCSNTVSNIGYVVSNLNLDNMSSEFNYHLAPYLNYYFPSGSNLIEELSKYNNNFNLQAQGYGSACGSSLVTYPGIEISNYSSLPSIDQYLNPLVSQFYYPNNLGAILQQCFPKTVTATLSESGQSSYTVSSPIIYNRYNYGNYVNDFVFNNLPPCYAMVVNGEPDSGASCFQIANNTPFSIGMYFWYPNNSNQRISVAPYAKTSLCSNNDYLAQFGITLSEAKNPIANFGIANVQTENFHIWYNTANIEINAN